MDRTAHFEDLLRCAGLRGADGEEIGRAIDGVTVHAAPRYGSQRHVERIAWWVNLAPSADAELDEAPMLVVRRRTALDAMGTTLGLNRSTTTGHEELDAMAYVETNASEDDVGRCLASPELQQAIADLIRQGLAVHLRGGRLTATQSSLLDELRLDEVLEIARGVSVVARRLPRFGRLAPDEGPDRFQRAGLGLVLLALGGAVAAAAASEQAIVEAATSPVVVGVIAVGIAACLAVAWRLCAGTSTGLRRFLLIAIPGVLAWVGWGIAVAAWSSALTAS